jgi:hypothetical protein
MVKSSPTACTCAEGRNFVAGRGCVTPIECRPPQVPNAARTGCVCPIGTVQKGRECVRPIQCQEPARPNRAGTACVCPQNMIARGNGCVPRVTQPKGKDQQGPGPRQQKDVPRGRIQ